MPKIHIRETDKTSSSTSGRYSNYAVLITGFRGTSSTTSKLISPDTNGVYEFVSADDFDKTIGLRGPEVKVKYESYGGERTEYHYGNQMAYELLKLGYPVLFKPINTIMDMKDAEFWQIFKDKVNYDFRFISHGLLTSSFDEATFTTLANRAARLNDVREVLNAIRVEQGGASATKENLDSAFNLIKNNYEEFIKVPNEDPTKVEYNYVDFKEAEEKIGELYVEAEALKTTFEQESITTTLINTINSNIANLAFYAYDTTSKEPVADVGRGDCIALIELDEKVYANQDSSESATNDIIQGIKTMGNSSVTKAMGSYCALTVPSVTYTMTANESFASNKKFPGAFHYLACFINSLNSGFAEWYAAAGYTRGISSYTIEKATVKLGEVAINALEPRNKNDNSPTFACNVITNFRGSYYLWGNRTAYHLGSDTGTANDLVASHFLNIRQLCTTVKKQLQIACRRFTFDPSSDTLWFNFLNAIKPTLEIMKADQGIRDYKVVKITDNTQKASFKARIRIIPIEAVEDFDLEVALEDSFNEVTVNEQA